MGEERLRAADISTTLVRNSHAQLLSEVAVAGLSSYWVDEHSVNAAVSVVSGEGLGAVNAYTGKHKV